ncbi:MAG: arginine--tRNA ligase, partial [Candidatus Cybelea sp.]
MRVDDALRSFADATAAAVTQQYPEVTPQVSFEAPRRPEFGDFASNVAFSLAKVARRPPQEVA